jgi:hypothetical protein
MGNSGYDFSSFQYAFSTIAQTIATGFALLTAVVMHRFQSITAAFPNRARDLEKNMDFGRHPDKRGDINQAYENGDWDQWLSIATGVGFPSGLDSEVLKSELVSPYIAGHHTVHSMFISSTCGSKSYANPVPASDWIATGSFSGIQRPERLDLAQ